MYPRNLEAGQVIDGFMLVEALAPGGMANFWRVRRLGDDLPMIMKIPLLRRGEDPLTIVGFEVEQMILARLTGPHVPKFVAAGDFERPYIVMEFIAGRPVRTFLEKTPLPAGEVAEIGAKIAFALHDLHRQHVIHLDLKPSNVILRDNGKPELGEGKLGEAVLIDFGLSRHAQLPDLVAEEFDDPVGTGPYIAPEQVRRDRGDPRSDIFALGVVLYFLATGERPFGEPQRAAEWRRRLWRDPYPPRHRNENVPPWLQEIILRCLAVDPAERYATAAQLAFDLQHPDQVPLTARATRRERDGPVTVAMRWLAARRQGPLPRRSVAGLLARAPIIMAAIDLAPEGESLRGALLIAVRRLLETEPGARLACVNAMRISRITLDSGVDAQGRNLHLQRLIALKHWARTLPAAADRITYHVIEATDPADALVDYARNNRIDHVVMGARGASPLRRLLGSVSAKVVAEAPCTVTVVRTRESVSKVAT
ncbi:MAG TPA: bifunctional serine/threonine-protein kinase/universal stress protein [Xanthobacteraceae bacterium]|nr:bifunctional serine/threonine-protein kinase/universal stress protein [Xanthobacteraceae bacterium]